MGKFHNSLIHDRYSDWHWRLVDKSDKYKKLYVADIDRLWLEYSFDKEAVLAVIDLKWEYSEDGVTSTEKGIYNWFQSVGVNCYIVFVNQEFTKFRVVNYQSNTECVYTDIEYADWLLSLRGKRYQFDYEIAF